MKKILSVLAIMLAVVVNAGAQSYNNLSVNGYDITIEEVVPVSKKSAKQMYDNTILWVNNHFSSPKSIIQSREDYLHILTLNFDTEHKNGSWLNMTLKVQFKDGRYKYTISDIWLKWDYDLRQLGANDEPYGKWVTHIKEGTPWKSELLAQIKPYIDSMKKDIVSSTQDNW